MIYRILALGKVASLPTTTKVLDSGWISDERGCKIFNANPKSDETVSWSGQCSSGYPDGTGTLSWYLAHRATSTFEGTMVGGYTDGRGVYRYSNGDRYEGDFAHGKKVGHGIYESPAGGCEGESENNELNGYAHCEYATGNRYDGDFLHGMQKGMGIHIWVNGNRYAGASVNGKMTGYGRFKFPNGDGYDGEFIDNQFDGRGAVVFADGTRNEGIFRKGALQGDSVLTMPSGEQYRIHYQPGVEFNKATQHAAYKLCLSSDKQVQIAKKLISAGNADLDGKAARVVLHCMLPNAHPKLATRCYQIWLDLDRKSVQVIVEP